MSRITACCGRVWLYGGLTGLALGLPAHFALSAPVIYVAWGLGGNPDDPDDYHVD